MISIILLDKIEDFKFAFINFQHLDCNITTAPVYVVLFFTTHVLLSSLQFVFRFFTTSPYSEY